MSYDFRVKKEQREVTNITPKETLEDVLKYPIKGNPQRGIRQDICEKFGVRCSLSEKDGKTVTAYYFPSHNQKGEIIGFSKQNLTLPKEAIGHWTAVGHVKIQNKMFGQHVAESNGRKRNVVTTTEGQWDTLSVYQAQIDDVKGTKYEGLEPFVVSIPLGTFNAVESMMHNKAFIKSFEELNVFFDNDECTPQELQKGLLKGKEAREAVAGAFMSDLKLSCTMTEHGFKDASDYMQNGKAKELAKLVSFDRKPLVVEKVVQVDSVDFDDLCTPLPQGVPIKSFPKLDDMLYGWRTGELTVVTARSGAGKTTGMTKIAEDAIEYGEKLGLIYLEEKNKQTLQRFVASKLKVSYKKFKRDPLSVASKDDVYKAYCELRDNKQLVMLDHFGSLSIKDLMNKIKHMYFVEGCRYILLDHLSMVISGSEITDERKEIDIVMTEIAAFCAANDVAVMLVVHLNRQGSSNILPPKGKEDQPFWATVTKESMRGSGSLEQIAWNVLGLEQEILPDRTRGRVRWVVLKNREGGDLGVADTFTINGNNWEVTLFEEDSPHPVELTKQQTVPQCFIEDIDDPFDN